MRMSGTFLHGRNPLLHGSNLKVNATRTTVPVLDVAEHGHASFHAAFVMQLSLPSAGERNGAVGLDCEDTMIKHHAF